MKKIIVTMIGLSLCSSLVACNNPERTVKKFEKSFGISVLLNTTKDDACMEASVRSLAEQYRDLSESAKAEFKRKLKESTKRIVVQPTETTLILGGEATFLRRMQWVLCGERSSCLMITSEKNIDDKRVPTFDNGVPKVKISRTATELTILPQASQDNSTHLIYETFNQPLYSQSSSVTDSTFTEGVNLQWIKYKGAFQGPRTLDCAPIRLSDLTQ